MRNALIEAVESKSAPTKLPPFRVGDTVDVHVKIVEGDKQRVQVFTGVVLGRRGEGTNKTFIVRRIVAGEGVERVFPVNSPTIAKLEVVRSGRVRRSKLYYLRERVGKATRLRDRGDAPGAAAKPAPAQEASAEAEPASESAPAPESEDSTAAPPTESAAQA